MSNTIYDAKTIRNSITAAQAYEHLTPNQARFKGNEAHVPCPICGSSDNLSINNDGKYKCWTPDCIHGKGCIDMAISLGYAATLPEACQLLGDAFNISPAEKRNSPQLTQVANHPPPGDSSHFVSSQDDQRKQERAIELHKREASEKFDQCIPVDDIPFGYPERKGIEPVSGRRAIKSIRLSTSMYIPANALVLDFIDNKSELVTLQYLSPMKPKNRTDKHFLSTKRIKSAGAKLPVCWHPIGRLDGAPIIAVSEGYATAISVYEAKNYAVVVTGGAANIPKVCKALKKLYPNARIIVVTDNDTSKAGEKAATKSGCDWTMVTRPDGFQGKSYDYNDLHRDQGLDAVRTQLDSNITLATHKDINPHLASGSVTGVTSTSSIAISGNATEKPDVTDVMSESNKPKIKLYDEDDRKKSQSTLLIEIATSFALFHDPDRRAYAEVSHKTHTEILQVRDRDFKELISHKFFRLTGKGANATALSDSLSTIEAIAKHDNPKHSIHIRTAGSHSKIYIDIGCDGWRVIEIDSEGWRVLNQSPVKFIRKRGMAALPEPETSGDIALLDKYINIETQDRPLIIGWMLCALAGIKPYPILILQGEQGTGKSTTSRVIRSLVDPSTVPLRSPPKDSRDLLVSASNTHVVVLDNLSGLNPELSDCLCRLSTGGGIDVRALFTDNEQVLIDIQKPVMANGIDDVATRPDLAQRSLIINLPVIESDSVQDEGDFWAEFEQDKGKIFAALLNGLSAGLKYRDSVELKEKPRMADVAQWVTACELGMGISDSDSFMKAYTRNQKEAVQTGIEASPVGSAIMELMSGRESWKGQPTELLAELERIVGANQIKSRSWPQSPKGLKNAIKRLTPSFRKTGIHITEGRNRIDGRFYNMDKVGLQASQVSQPAPCTGFRGDACVTDRESVTHSVTDENAMCHPLNPQLARAVTDVTLVTDKNRTFPLSTHSENDVEHF